MDIYARVCDHIRSLNLQTPRLNNNGRQIIQEDRPPQHNDRDISVESSAIGAASRDLARNRSLPIPIQITIKNINQKHALDDCWKLAESFDNLPHKETDEDGNNEWVTIQSNDGSFLFESSEVYVQPRKLMFSEHNAAIYIMMVHLHIELGGKR